MLFRCDRPGFKPLFWHLCGKWPNLSDLQFTHLHNLYVTGVSLGLNETEVDVEGRPSGTRWWVDAARERQG